MTTNLGLLDPQNEDKFIEDLDALDEDTRKERIRNFVKERNEVLDSNRKLFSRAKEAEGFKQDDDGNWIKTVEKKPEAKSSVKSDEELLKRVDNLSLSAAGILEADEVELANGNWTKYQESGGIKKFEEFIRGDGFQADLKDLRTTKANQKATSKIRGEPGQSEAKNEPDYWIAKATKGPDGNLLFPEEMPKEVYTKVLAKLAASSGENSEELRFYNK